MALRSPNYALVLVLLIISTGITTWARTRPALEILPSNVASMPVQIGEWHKLGTDHVLGKDVLDGWLVSENNFLSRTYQNQNEDTVALMLVYKGLDRRGWHLSEMCFSGSGYSVNQSVTDIPYAGKVQQAVKLVARNTETMATVVSVYWFARGPLAEHNFWRQQGQMALSRLDPPEEGWAFVRVTSEVRYSEDQAEKLIKDFIRDASDSLVGAIASTDSN